MEIRVGAFDRAYHFVDGATGRDVRPSLPTADLAKGSATSDPDGYPLYYGGSRDNKLRIVALDRRRPTVLWALDSHDGGRVVWNDDWDGAPLVVRGHLLVGGENSWFYVIRLNRSYGPDGKVRVRPRVVARVPGWDRRLLAARPDSRLLDRVVGRLRSWSRVFRQLGRSRAGLGRAAHDALRRPATPRVPLLDGRRHRCDGGDRRAGLPLRGGGAGALRRALPSSWPARQARPAAAARPRRLVGAASARGPCRQGRLVVDARDRPHDRTRGHECRRSRGRRQGGAATCAGPSTSPGPTWGSPVVVDGVLLEGDCLGVLHAFDVRDQRSRPRPLWSIRLGGCIESTPAVWRGRVYVGTRGGALYAIGS